MILQLRNNLMIMLMDQKKSPRNRVIGIKSNIQPIFIFLNKMQITLKAKDYLRE